MGQGQVWRSWRVEGLPRRYKYLYTFIYLCTFIYLYTFIYSYTFIYLYTFTYLYTFIYLYLYVYPGDLWLPDIELYNTKVTNVTPIFGCLSISHPGEIVSWSLTLSDFHSVGVSGPFGDNWDQTSRPESYSAYAWQVHFTQPKAYQKAGLWKTWGPDNVWSIFQDYREFSLATQFRNQPSMALLYPDSEVLWVPPVDIKVKT